MKIRTFFPATRGRWLLYTKTSLPVILAAMVFALNNFVDNFSAIKIPGGNQALSYANSWTSMVSGLVAATALVGSALFGQYLGLDDKRKIREVLRARMVLALAVALAFALPALIAPEFMTMLISGFDAQLPADIAQSTASYTRIISLSWLLSAWGYTNSMILREAGHGTVSLLSALTSLVSNIVLNVAFIFGLGEDISYLAYSTLVSMVISIGFMNLFIWFRDKRIAVNPLRLLAVSGLIWRQFAKRSSSFVLLALGSAAVSIRFIFWNSGYPTGSVGTDPLYNLSAATVLGISGMFFNVFWTTFESINANVAIFVGKELGNNNIAQAQANARELQGFHLLTALIMGTSLFALSFAVVHMDFLTEGYKAGLSQELAAKFPEASVQQIRDLVASGATEFLANLQITLWPLSWNMPLWIWYITKKIIISSGGLTNLTSLVDTASGIIQIIWIIIINLVIVKTTSLPFPWAYALFFVSDLTKVPVFEYLYYKSTWARNLTLETVRVCEDEVPASRFD